MPVMAGSELVNRITDRPVNFPIVVISPWDGTAKWVSDFAGYGLNISLLPQPFTLEEFKQELERLLKTKN